MVRALAFDTESSGPNPRTDRLVTAYLGLVDLSVPPVPYPPGPIREQEWVCLPEWGFEMPAEAAEVNGYSTRRLHLEAEGSTADAVEQIIAIIVGETDPDTHTEPVPIVAYNAAFDMTLLYHEALRAGIDPSPLERVFVLDPYVMWKRLDPKRRGGRKLTDAVHAYHLHFPDGAYHTARFDAMAASAVMSKQLRNDLNVGMPIDVIHEGLRGWYRDQTIEFIRFKRATNPAFTASLDWPIQKEAVA